MDVNNYPVKDLALIVMKQWPKANVLFVIPFIVTERHIVAKIEVAYNVAQDRRKKSIGKKLWEI